MMTAMITLVLAGLLRGIRTQRALVLENLALRHQLAVLQRTAPRPRLRPSDRLFWVLLSRLWHGWAEAVAIVQPETVIRVPRPVPWTLGNPEKVGSPPSPPRLEDAVGANPDDAGLRPGQDDVELAEEALGIAGRL